MTVFSLNHVGGKLIRIPIPLYEDFITASYSSNLVAFWHLADASSPATDSTANAYNSTAVGSGVSFANTNKIPNTNKTSVLLNGTNNQTYVQLEASPGSRLRLTNWTLNIWFRRLGTGNTNSTGTGTGGIIAEPLFMKGGAESETLGLNMNWGMGIEALDSSFYLSADYEKDATNSSTHPTGRNARMLDCSVASNTFTLRAHTTAAAGATAHTYSNGERVRFGGTAITGITPGTWYYLVNVNQGAGTFQTATTSGGSAMTGLGTVAAGGGAWFNHCKGSVLLGASDTGWHMATCTWDGTNLKTYLDAVLAENEVPTMKPAENVSTQCGAIGAMILSNATTRNGAFNGGVQFASIHSAALAASDVLSIYQNGTNIAAPPASPPPSATLLAPSSDQLPFPSFVVQLTDALSVSDASVVTGSVVLKKNGSTLTVNTDYSFAYNSTTDRITLTSLTGGGLFAPGSYQVILN